MVISEIFTASGFFLGSSVYTASTEVAFTTLTASISEPTIMATASVVCPGSVPPMTAIFPGSAMVAVSAAVSGTFKGMFPRASPRSCALSLVAPMPRMSSWYVSPPSSLPVSA